MKKKCLFLLFGILITGLTSCSFLSNLAPLEKEVNPIEDNIDYSKTYNNDSNKKHLNYTYNDLSTTNMYGLDYLPSTGEPALLIIPVKTKDSKLTTQQRKAVKEDLYKVFFGTNEETGWRSVRTYFAEESFGKLNLKGTVTDWFDSGLKANDITSDKTDQLVSKAVEWYKKETGTYLNNFDTNKNGLLDSVILIYDAPNYGGDSKKNDNLWAYTYWLDKDSSVFSPNPCAFTWASYDFMYGSNNKSGVPGNGGDTSNCVLDAHTYIHELGHLLGLNDYYDYAGKEGYAAAGGWIMQDYNVGSHDSYTKMSLGWIDPYVISKDTTIEIKSLQESGDFIILSPKFNNSPFDEYLIIDLFAPVGNNAFDTLHSYNGVKELVGSKTPGCRIWHVDSRLVTPSNAVKGDDGYYYPVYTNNEFYFSTDPTKESTYGWTHLVTNTTYTSSTTGYASPLAKTNKDFAEYRQLQLIRQNNTAKEAYKDGTIFNENHLFKTGDTFSMDLYKNAFYKTGKFNNGLNLNVEVSFKSVNKDSATLEIIFK